MKNLNYNQIKIFINLEIIREEDKNKKNIYHLLSCFLIKKIEIFKITLKQSSKKKKCLECLYLVRA